MTNRRETVARIRLLSQDHWSAKYMLLIAAGFLTDVQLEAVVQAELEVGEAAIDELARAYRPTEVRQIHDPRD